MLVRLVDHRVGLRVILRGVSGEHTDELIDVLLKEVSVGCRRQVRVGLAQEGGKALAIARNILERLPLLASLLLATPSVYSTSIPT